MPSQSSDPSPVVGGSYGERIEKALGRRGRTRAWLAKRIGVRWQTVQHWIQGKHEPDGANLRAIAEALEMTVDELLGILDGQDPPFPAWAAWLAEPEGQTMTIEERRTLAGVPWPRGVAPTVTSYRLLLTAIRTGTPRDTHPPKG